MADSIQILERLDDAIKAHINAQKEGILRWTDRDDQEREIPILVAWDDMEDEDGNEIILSLPMVAISCTDATERTVHDGNFTVTAVIEVIAHPADTTRADYRKWAGLIGALLYRSDIAVDLSALGTNLTVKHWTNTTTSRPAESQFIESDHAMVTRFEADVYCYPMD